MVMKQFLALAKALSDEGRVRTLMFLSGGELCVCQIIEMLGLAPSTVSKHMSILHQAGLVESRKDGRWIYYRLVDDKAPRPVREALDWLQRCLRDTPVVRADALRLREVRKMQRDSLCAHYKANATQCSPHKKPRR
jgi:ArsR family transcriptional regulator, arsenate/arsenite/antimonite-responsive transcriptional repressor